MPVSISDYLDVDVGALEATGAFDAILDIDSHLFIDPLLLRQAGAPEFSDVGQVIDRHLNEILRLLHASSRVGDAAWRAAGHRLQFRELPGLSIGYSAKGTSGSGIGDELRDRLLYTSKEIVTLGIADPAIFELIGLLEEGIGADRISDMFARIAIRPIAEFSARVFWDLGVATTEPWVIGDTEFALPQHPFARNPVLLLPRDVLRDLPVAHSWDEIDDVISANAALRDRVNALIGDSWSHARQYPKQRLRRLLLSSPETFRDLIAVYKRIRSQPYDFASDPRGQVVWYLAAHQAVADLPMRLVLPSDPTPEDVLEVVVSIVERFKRLVELNKWWSLLYNADGGRKPEEAAQLLLFGLADSYCDANDLDISREANGGRGPVDFKVSHGYRSRVVAEVKLSSNPQLVHGYEVQVDEYQKAELTRRSVYIVIDVGGSDSRLRALRDRVGTDREAGKRYPRIFYVDGRPKASASVYEPVPARWDGVQ